jgi:hypothetical protein
LSGLYRWLASRLRVSGSPPPGDAARFLSLSDAVARIRLVLRSRVTGWLLCARRAIRPFSCMRMCQLQSAHHQGFKSDTPKKDLLHTFEQRRYSQEQMQCPQSTANWKITSRDTNSDLTFFYCCENDRLRNSTKRRSLPRKKRLRNFVAFVF